MKILHILIACAVLLLGVSASLTQGKNPKPKSSANAFSVVILPDTQIYAERYPEIFTAQTEWIAENAEKENIAFVLHEGDLTHTNSVEEWANAKRSMSILDGKVPYVLVPGNHDYAHWDGSRDTHRMNEYFPFRDMSEQAHFGGAFEEGKVDNTYHLFRAGGMDWLVLALEFGPRDEVLEWADNVVTGYPGRNVIVLTHAYLFSDNTHHGSRSSHEWKAGQFGADNDGVDVWNKLLRRHSNVRFVFSGHVLNSGTGQLVSEGDAGNRVYQVLANYQMNRLGGEGFLRIVRVYPEEQMVHISTFSPYLDEFKKDSANDFYLYDIDLKSGSRNSISPTGS